MTDRKDKTAGIIGVVAIIMLTGKLAGLARDILLRATYGTQSAEAKAISLSTSIPRNFLDFAFASVISAAFIPVFVDVLTKRGKAGEDGAYRLADSFVSIVIIAAAFVSAVMALFAPQIAAAFAPGYSREALTLSARLLRLMSVTILLSGAAFSLTGVLQSLGGFNAPAAMSVISNLLIIGYLYFLSDRFGAFGLCAAFVFGWASQVIILIPPLIRRGYIFRPRFRLGQDGLGGVWRLMPAAVVGSWVLPVNQLVSQRFGSLVDDGAGAVVIDTASQLFMVITGVFVLSVSNVVFPKLSKQASEGGVGFGETIQGVLRVSTFIIIPMTFGLMALGKPLVSLLFERGAFDQTAASKTSAALLWYAPGMLGFAMQNILSRAFYAVRDVKTPIITGFIAIFINGLLGALLYKPFGTGGVAAASSAALTVTGIAMVFVMNRRACVIPKGSIMGLFKTLFCGIIMSAVVFGLFSAFGGEGFVCRAIGVIAAVAAGGAVYMALGILLKLRDAVTISKWIMALLSRTKED